MNMISKIESFACAALTLSGALLLAEPASATTSDFYPAYLQAKVVAHLPLSGGVRQMFLQQEGRKQYLYVQQSSQQGFTVFDVTKAAKPKTVSYVPQEKLTMVGSGLAIAENPENRANAGDSHLAGSAEGTRGGGAIAPESVRVLDTSDPAHVRTVQTFNGVRSVVPDDARNLIYVANGDGIWILSHKQVLRRHECSSEDDISPIPNCN
ncbi:MAG: hypothetical protein WBE44_21685 [Terriglobales bacterium]|jgi:hypothetical protein